MSGKKPVARREIKVAVAYPPYVNLLPPEVGQRKAAARARRRAIFFSLVALGIAILAAAGANVYSLQRVVALDNARSQSLSLTTQQGKFNDVRMASQLLQSTQAARIFAFSTEVSVEKLIAGLNSNLSSDMAITDYSFDTASPLQIYGQSISPLDPESMAGFSIQVTANSIASLDEWVRKLPSVEGVIGATLVTVQREEDAKFLGTVTVLVGSGALLHRFDGFVKEGPSSEEQAPESPDSPAPTNSPDSTSGTDDEENGS